MKKSTIKDDQVLFLVKELLAAGVDSGDKFNALLTDISKAGSYKIIPWKEDSFFTELATKMRELWPTGLKDGKYPWRDSVQNLATRLKELWEIKMLGDQYTIDDCLLVARKYLGQFGDDRKYMRQLKYFIGKQTEMFVKRDGQVKYEVQSDFANMLEALSDEDRLLEQSTEDSWNFTEQGELV